MLIQIEHCSQQRYGFGDGIGIACLPISAKKEYTVDETKNDNTTEIPGISDAEKPGHVWLKIKPEVELLCWALEVHACISPNVGTHNKEAWRAVPGTDFSEL